MGDNKYSISFVDLLDKENKVEIPIIQRDYAQGRVANVEIIKNFLNAIAYSLNQNKELELDFIYGSTEKDSFQPLDGQQRLTTLFLLHWYGALKDNKLAGYRDLLKKFSYETRITSREFCLALINSEDIILDDRELSIQIMDSKWFFMSWKNDQTIEAMLRALDLIQNIFDNVKNISELLFDKKLIRFYNINLENIGLTDDLYIKMNARGKLLSPFENFKAVFEKYIKDSDFEHEVTPLESFAFKIDTKWTDFFWENFRNNSKVDSSIMKMLSTLIMFRLVIEKKNQRIALIQNLQDNPNEIKTEYISKDSFQYIESILDFYTDKFNLLDFSFHFSFFRHNPSKNFLAQVVDITVNTSYTQKVLFFAQTEYFLRNEELNEEKFNDWMRVVRNIVARGSVTKGGKRPDIIRSPETFDGVINLIFELANGSNDIYEYLSKTDKLNSTFARDQIEEERYKSKLITERYDLRKIIFEMEDLNLFKGRISFAFRCIKYDYNVQNFNENEFIRVKQIVEEYFNNENADISNDIRRALMTVEINSQFFYEYWWSHWYVADATKRCLIENFNELEYLIYYTEQSKFLKELVRKMIHMSLDQIIDEYNPKSDTPNWMVRLIKEKQLLDSHCRSNYIAIDQINNICYLLRSKRPRDKQGCYEVR